VTLLVRSPDGSVRCATATNGEDAVVEGSFGEGILEIFVGSERLGENLPYMAGYGTRPGVDSRAALASMMGAMPGMVLRDVSLRVVEADGGSLRADDVCRFLEVVRDAEHTDQTLRCGLLAYHWERPIADPDRARGFTVNDTAPSREDGSPSFVWSRADIVLGDGPEGAQGAFRVRFVPVPSGFETP
jgi:hypothetical protein